MIKKYRLVMCGIDIQGNKVGKLAIKSGKSSRSQMSKVGLNFCRVTYY